MRLRHFAFRRFSVPHDRLFLDALERDLKREKDGQQPTTEVIGEPARSFRYASHILSCFYLGYILTCIHFHQMASI